MIRSESKNGTERPYLTVIMAIMNVADDFKKTLDSLDEQEYKSFEVLVADCDSRDNPARHIAGHPYRITHYVQRDEGIYDAWNKVLPFATGEWVVFMGAGDKFCDSTSLLYAVNFLASLDENVLMAYGKANIIGENGNIIDTIGCPWVDIRSSLVNFGEFPHQATFQRTRSFKEFGLFDKTMNIVADKDMILRLAAVRQPEFFPVVVANFVYGGISNSHKTKDKAARQHLEMLRNHGFKPSNRHWVTVKLFALRILQKVFNDRGSRLATDLYRRLTGRAKRFG